MVKNNWEIYLKNYIDLRWFKKYTPPVQKIFELIAPKITLCVGRTSLVQKCTLKMFNEKIIVFIYQMLQN